VIGDRAIGDLIGDWDIGLSGEVIGPASHRAIEVSGADRQDRGGRVDPDDGFTTRCRQGGPTAFPAIRVIASHRYG
jgi:hypothetical protein